MIETIEERPRPANESRPAASRAAATPDGARRNCDRAYSRPNLRAGSCTWRGTGAGNLGPHRWRSGYRQVDSGPASGSGIGRCQGSPVLYVSAEESAQQIRLRADRLGVHYAKVLVLSGTDLDEILASANAVQPSLLIVDSIQTVSVDEITSAAGSVSQVTGMHRSSHAMGQEPGRSRSSSSGT